MSLNFNYGFCNFQNFEGFNILKFNASKFFLKFKRRLSYWTLSRQLFLPRSFKFQRLRFKMSIKNSPWKFQETQEKLGQRGANTHIPIPPSGQFFRSLASISIAGSLFLESLNIFKLQRVFSESDRNLSEIFRSTSILWVSSEIFASWCEPSEFSLIFFFVGRNFYHSSESIRT